MSQRLHVGQTTKVYYDCVIQPDDTRTFEALVDTLESDWLCVTGMFSLGPWKITIADWDLWVMVEPAVDKVISLVPRNYPDDIWAFYHTGHDGIKHALVHPTRNELDAWVRSMKQGRGWGLS